MGHDAHCSIESGVLFPVLPGESLLFTAGLLHDKLGIHLPTLILLVVIAAFVGAQIGYFLGAKWGRRFFKPDARILKNAHLEKGRNTTSRTTAAARSSSDVFIPFVRTFIPIAAGMARYPYPKFLAFNTLGSIVWGAGFILVERSWAHPLRARQPDAHPGCHHPRVGPTRHH